MINKFNSIVWVKLPSAGIGNKLSVWARGIIFSETNKFSIIVTGWTQLKIGPFWRGEKKKRIYYGYFRHPTIYDYINLLFAFIIFKRSYTLNPSDIENNNTLFLFNNYRMDFNDISPHREMIKKRFFNFLSSEVIEQSNDLIKPEIGLHIRRGDFKKIGPLTPITFYIEVIKYVRKLVNEIIPVLVYTDAYPNEINELLLIESVSLASKKSDILDLIELSRSKVIIAASNSTFSYWACFLGNSLVLKHPDEWFPHLRGSQLSNISNEWVVDVNNFNNLHLDDAIRKALN